MVVDRSENHPASALGTPPFCFWMARRRELAGSRSEVRSRFLRCRRSPRRPDGPDLDDLDGLAASLDHSTLWSEPDGTGDSSGNYHRRLARQLNLEGRERPALISGRGPKSRLSPALADHFYQSIVFKIRSTTTSSFCSASVFPAGSRTDHKRPRRP
jgi:hypothetical protein